MKPRILVLAVALLCLLAAPSVALADERARRQDRHERADRSGSDRGGRRHPGDRLLRRRARPCRQEHRVRGSHGRRLARHADRRRHRRLPHPRGDRGARGLRLVAYIDADNPVLRLRLRKHAWMSPTSRSGSATCPVRRRRPHRRRRHRRRPRQRRRHEHRPRRQPHRRLEGLRERRADALRRRRPRHLRRRAHRRRRHRRRSPWRDGGYATVQFRGVAPAADIVGIKVLDETGQGRTSTVIAGIAWAIETQGPTTTSACSTSRSAATRSAPSGAIRSPMAVEAAWQHGIVVVCAAGNEGDFGAGRHPLPRQRPLRDHRRRDGHPADRRRQRRRRGRRTARWAPPCSTRSPSRTSWRRATASSRCARRAPSSTRTSRTT